MELKILHWFEELHNPVLDFLMYQITCLGNGGLIWLVIAAAMLFVLPKRYRKTGATVVAALISFSRLYLTVHYPTDVLASVVFGSAYGGAAYLLMKKVLEKPGRLRKVLVEGASYKTLWKK